MPATTTHARPGWSRHGHGPIGSTACSTAARSTSTGSPTPGRPEFDEQIAAAHVVWDRENPEVIAEVTRIRHEQVGGAPATVSLGYYVQAAYRLPDPARLWKPYFRFEHIGIPADDQVFAGIPVLDGTTVGIRYDVSTYAAAQGRSAIAAPRQRPATRKRLLSPGLFHVLTIAWTDSQPRARGPATRPNDMRSRNRSAAADRLRRPPIAPGAGAAVCRSRCGRASSPAWRSPCWRAAAGASDRPAPPRSRSSFTRRRRSTT